MKSCPRVRSPRLTGPRLIIAGVFLSQVSGCARAPAVADAADRSPGSASPVAQTVPHAEIQRLEHGKAIYLTAISPSGQPIKARLEGSGVVVPAAVLTCVNCHGLDGVGKAEGGITPATITWNELTKDYGRSHPSGRQRPAYDDRSVRRAITMGLDPSGRALDPSMPRYALTRDDLDDLVLYLKELGTDSDRGITEQAIVVGTILAPPGSLGELHRAVKSVLTAYFQEVNNRGGIYGRRVELRCLTTPETAEERGPAAHPFLKSQQAFALVAPFIAGSEDELTDAARDEKVPVVGAFTFYPKLGYPLNRHVFYLHAGLTDQVRALAVFAGNRLASRKPVATVLFLESDPNSHAAAEVAKAECDRLGWEHVELRPLSSSPRSEGLIDELKCQKPEVVLVVSPEGQDLVRPLMSRIGRLASPGADPRRSGWEGAPDDRGWS